MGEKLNELFQVGNKKGNPLCGIQLRLQKKNWIIPDNNHNQRSWLTAENVSELSQEQD